MPRPKPPGRRRSSAARRRRPRAWVHWPDQKLLALRFCDLKLRIERSPLQARIEQLYRELAAAGLAFRPYFWLSDEWFTPDGVPGIAIPFYLAHPRLAQLEQSQVLEVEGGSPAWCMRILRHETGHAIENAYRLRRRRSRQRLFGRSSQPYPSTYAPKPYSKSFVLHLDSWYAQSHPDEDFAETFAVWLNPRSVWRRRYLGWPALKKLEYMDELMKEIGGQQPLVRSRVQVDSLPRLRKTLGQHYQEKRQRYSLDRPNFYDRDLRRLFSDTPSDGRPIAAHVFLEHIRREVCRKVARWTGTYQYTIDQVLEDMIERCQKLRLHLRGAEEQATLDFTVLLTVQTMNYLHSGQHRVAL